MVPRRPSSKLNSIIIFTGNSEDGWTPRKIEVDSWVALEAPNRGPWAVSTRHRPQNSHDVEFKAQIKGFKLKPNSTIVETVLVSHAYSFKQLILDPTCPESKILKANRANYIYPTKYQDWEDPRCIIDLIYVTHAEVGEVCKGTRTHKQLLSEGIFFYNAMYSPPTSSAKFGKLSYLPLPSLDDPSWPLPDNDTSERYRARFFKDFQSAMKTSTGSQVNSLSWFMPMHTMVDFFGSYCSDADLRKTPTLFKFHPISEQLFGSLMDEGWDIKREVASDGIKCVIDRHSVSFRYNVGREKLYTSFQYNRLMMVGTEWIPLDQIGVSKMIEITVEFPSGNQMKFDVGEKWTLEHLHEEISFSLEEGMLEDFDMTFVKLQANGKKGKGKRQKVNPRQGKKLTGGDVDPDYVVRIMQSL